MSDIVRFLLVFLALSTSIPSFSAENLKMRDGVSFVHDLDSGFPIIGDKLDDVSIATAHPTLVFFGACGDLNTNRQAKRIVDIYKKYHPLAVKFVVIDVDHPVNAEAKQLVKTYYQGYIPSELLFDKTGKQKWTHTGEIEQNALAVQVDKAL